MFAGGLKNGGGGLQGSLTKEVGCGAGRSAPLAEGSVLAADGPGGRVGVEVLVSAGLACGGERPLDTAAGVAGDGGGGRRGGDKERGGAERKKERGPDELERGRGRGGGRMR
jgi:hypothetical protein